MDSDMFLILLALISVTAISSYVAARGYSSWFTDILTPLVAMIGSCCLLAYSVLYFDYVASDYKARIINAEYGTTYTQLEVFYANSVIDTIRHLNRSRIELNGDLIKGE